jgi:hypothetical protein
VDRRGKSDLAFRAPVEYLSPAEYAGSIPVTPGRGVVTAGSSGVGRRRRTGRATSRRAYTQGRLANDGLLKTQIPPRHTRRGDLAPHDPAGDQGGVIVRGKRFLALTAATGTATTAAAATTAEDASAAGSAAEDAAATGTAAKNHFRGAGLSHGHRLSLNPSRPQYDSK